MKKLLVFVIVAMFALPFAALAAAGSGSDLSLEDGDYNATLPLQTNRGTCDRFNVDQLTVRFTKDGKNLSASVDEEEVTLKGKLTTNGWFSGGGPAVQKIYSRKGRNIEMFVIGYAGLDKNGEPSFVASYVKKKGSKVTCYRWFDSFDHSKDAPVKGIE